MRLKNWRRPSYLAGRWPVQLVGLRNKVPGVIHWYGRRHRGVVVWRWEMVVR
jgi:hypothetical protein